MKSWLYSFVNLLFPRYCPVCNNAIGKNDGFLCVGCDMDIPRTGFHTIPDNRMEKLLWGRMPIEKATAWFYYSRGSKYRQLIHKLKYYGQKEFGIKMGKYLAEEIKDSGFFYSVDYLIPVPLHSKRLKERGYNQSEMIALGVSQVTSIPVLSDCIIRSKQTETQTRKSNFERIENMDGVFELSPDYNLAGKHIILIDDVITTGATIVACGNALHTNESDIKISVITLGIVSS